MLLDIGMCHQNIVWKAHPRLHHKQSERIVFLGVGEGGMPQNPPSRYTRLCVHERAFACYYHPATILFSPPNSKSYMKTPWLGVGTETRGHVMIGKGTPLKTNFTLHVCADN